VASLAQARVHLQMPASSSYCGGLPVDAGVRIEVPDRAGLSRLLCYLARPPFAMDRLKQRGADLVYR